MFFIVNGLSTFLYGPISLSYVPQTIGVVVFAMVVSGLTSAHTLIPAVPEIIEAGREELGYPENVLSDFSAGLFNMNFAIGEAVGPFIGNKLYVDLGMETTSNMFGGFVLMFTLLYFIT